jgi:ABC-2 type transport system permease protein
MASSNLASLPHSQLSSETVLERVNARPAFWTGFIPTVREVYQYRELLGQLVRKELKVKYKDSVLGFLWTFIRPLLQLFVYSVVIGVFLGSSKSIPAFGIYIYVGLLAWTLFTEILGGCTGSIVNNGGLVKKVYFPRELFPLSVVFASLINFVLQCSVLLVAYAFAQSGPAWSQMGLLPLALLVLLLFGMALGLLLAASNVFLRDIQYLVEVGLLLWFWMTPIIYDWTKVRDVLVVHHHLGWLYQVFLANPMADVVLAFQRALWSQGKGTPFYYTQGLALRLAVLAVVCAAFLWLAQRIFARTQGNFAQEL